MNEEITGTYRSWRDSLLAKKITSPSKGDRMDAIWNKANIAYPRATWPGWIDHSVGHILNVLRNLDNLVPSHVLDTISETEAFVLIAATLLHDIGMVPEENTGTGLQYFANLRLQHGERGIEIIKKDFSDFLDPFGDILNPVCEIVKNHHGNFNPVPRISLPYDLRADALWIRLADELDFGPHHAPSWLLDYIRPDENELQHWKRHNQIQVPAIDLKLFRIQVTGIVEDESLIRKLRVEFEAPQMQDLQKNFLNRGLGKQEHNRTLIIWDMTKKRLRADEDRKAIDARPIIFSNDQFLLGARYLYNLGRYEAARKCFEDGIGRLSGRWSDMPAVPYFYHYIKSLHALGCHQEALEVVDQYRDADFPSEIRAAIAISNGIGNWKLGNFTSAVDSFRTAIDLYRNLSQYNVRHKIDEADAWILYSITYLEIVRASKDDFNRQLIINIEHGLNNAETLFSEYEEKNTSIQESHYKGRYWGLKAFFCLLQIDIQSSQRTSEMWDNAIRFAKNAHGGEELTHRNPFGAMCGKYCESVVNYHKYKNCENEFNKYQALLESARIIGDVQHTYDDLFGFTKRIFRLWPKVHRIFMLVQRALPDETKRILPVQHDSDEIADEIEVYTPLN